MGFLPLHVANHTDSAGIVFEAGIVKALRRKKFGNGFREIVVYHVQELEQILLLSIILIIGLKLNRFQVSGFGCQDGNLKILKPEA